MRTFHGIAVALILGMAAAATFLTPYGSAVAQGGDARETYAAIAAGYSDSAPFASGTANDAESRAAAARQALASCRSSDCVLILEYSGRGCSSYYVSNDGADYAWGWALEPALSDADRIALEVCEEQLRPGEWCNHSVHVCNVSGGEPQIIQGKSSKGEDQDL